jgi:hypothetical protein
MPITNIDNINIRYGKGNHLRNHTVVATQFKAWLFGKTGKQQTFTIWNEGPDKDYSYLAQNMSGAWRIHTRQIWIDEEAGIFMNVIDVIDDLIVRDETSSCNPRYFS